YRAVHQVDGYLTFSWIKTNNMTVAFAPAVVFVVVGIKPDSAHIPHLWLMPAYSLHHFNKHLAIFYGLLIIKRSNIVFDSTVVLRSYFVYKLIVLHKIG